MEAGASLAQVQSGVDSRIERLVAGLDPSKRAQVVGQGGRFRRSQLAVRLCTQGGLTWSDETRSACVAAELLHAATLCHDDVIDAAPRRRHGASVWAATTIGGAVLLGDLLLTEAVLVLAEQSPSRVQEFLQAMKEMAKAELEVEMNPRVAAPALEAWLAHNKAKTGVLFGFVAGASGGAHAPLARTLSEAGTRIGVVYQILDDLIDVYGQESIAGKPTGLDEARFRVTPARENPQACVDAIVAECSAAHTSLEAWPKVAEALSAYVSNDLLPFFSRAVEGSKVAVELDSRLSVASAAR